jgi:4,4'-diaponeurosporenoate glycosyltransferase
MIKLLISLIVFFISMIGFFRILRFYSPKVAKLKLLDLENDCCLLSIIIPCRNEEKRLPNLLNSLKKQTYQNFEIIIVDDDSTDNTISIAKSYNAKVIQRKEIFPDWEGKSASCYAGAMYAQGEILLFLDADVILRETALEYLLRHFQSDGVISCQPYHYLERFYENLSLYPNLILILGLGAGKKSEPFSTDNGLYGPCIMISKDLYIKTGGHKLVGNSVIEDVDLGIKLAQKGVKITIVPHNNLIRFRMYPEGVMTLINGWTKNMSLGAARSKPQELIIITAIISFSVGIFNSLIGSFNQKDFILLSIYSAMYIFYGIFLFIVSRKFGRFSPITIVLYPFFAMAFILIFIRSILVKIFRLKLHWRGRQIKI